MNPNSITYCSDLDIWRDELGCEFVKNEFNPSEIVWIPVTGDVWSLVQSGQLHVLDWNQIRLPKLVIAELKFVVKQTVLKED